jgi:dUTPase
MTIVKLTKYGSIDVMLNSESFIPEETDDPGEVYYIRTPETILLYSHESITIDTGISVILPYGHKGVLRSIYELDKNVVIDESRIDGTGNESISVTIHSGDTAQYFRKGDIIAKLVILPSCTPELEKQHPTTVYKIEIRRAKSGKQYLVLCTKDGYVILDDDGYPEKISTDIVESLTLVESLHTTLFYDREF